jgi:hypothetical protein
MQNDDDRKDDEKLEECALCHDLFGILDMYLCEDGYFYCKKHRF